MAEFRRRMRPMLGTFIEVGVPAGNVADAAIEKAFLQIEKIEQLLNRHDPLSELSRLNSARGAPIEMSRLSLRVIRLARRLIRLSSGRFNCGHKDCAAADIEIRGSSVRLHRGVKLSLDGIAKGFAVDLAIKSLQRSGVETGWVNAGGDLRVFGDLDVPLWRRESDGQFKLLSKIRNAAVATSQGTQQDPSFQAEIVAPEGSSPHAGVWSVLAPTAWLADALTKVACVSEDHERFQIIERLGGHLVASETT
jgi:thiamine biosynthesis lipoprotein